MPHEKTLQRDALEFETLLLKAAVQDPTTFSTLLTALADSALSLEVQDRIKKKALEELTEKTTTAGTSFSLWENAKEWVDLYIEHNIPLTKAFLDRILEKGYIYLLYSVLEKGNLSLTDEEIADILFKIQTPYLSAAGLMLNMVTNYVSTRNKELSRFFNFDLTLLCNTYLDLYDRITTWVTKALFTSLHLWNPVEVRLLLDCPQFINFNAKDSNGNGLVMVLLQKVTYIPLVSGWPQFLPNPNYPIENLLDSFLEHPVDFAHRNYLNKVGTVFTIEYGSDINTLDNNQESCFTRYFTKLISKFCEQEQIEDLIFIESQRLSTWIGLQTHDFKADLFKQNIIYITGDEFGLRIHLSDIGFHTIPWENLPSNFPRQLVENLNQKYIDAFKLLEEKQLIQMLGLRPKESLPEICFIGRAENELHIKCLGKEKVFIIPLDNLPETFSQLLTDDFCARILPFFYEIAACLNSHYIGLPLTPLLQNLKVPTGHLDLPRAKILLACNRTCQSLPVRYKYENTYSTYDFSLVTCAMLENKPKTYQELRLQGVQHMEQDLFLMVAKGAALQKDLEVHQPLDENLIANYFADMRAKNLSEAKLGDNFVNALEHAASKKNLVMVQQLLTFFAGETKQTLIGVQTPIVIRLIIQYSTLFNQDVILAALAAIGHDPKIVSVEALNSFIEKHPQIEHQIVSSYGQNLTFDRDNPDPNPFLNKAKAFKQILSLIPPANKSNGSITLVKDSTFKKMVALKNRMTEAGCIINWGQKFAIQIRTRPSFFPKKISLEEHIKNMSKANPKKYEEICNAHTVEQFTSALSIHANAWLHATDALTTSTKIFLAAKCD